MITVYLVITNTGDGANGLQWFRDTPYEKLITLEDKDPDYYGSGDGMQITTLYFPDNFDFEAMGVEDWEWADKEAFGEYEYEDKNEIDD